MKKYDFYKTIEKIKNKKVFTYLDVLRGIYNGNYSMAEIFFADALASGRCVEVKDGYRINI